MKKIKNIGEKAAVCAMAACAAASVLIPTAEKMQAPEKPTYPEIQIIEGSFPNDENEGWVEVPDETEVNFDEKA